MHCSLNINDAFAHLDGEGPSKYEQHVMECAKCQEHLAEARKARGIWAHAANIELNDRQWVQLDRAVRLRIAEEHERTSVPTLFGFGRGLAWAGALAALAIAVYVSILGTGNTKAPHDAPVTTATETRTDLNPGDTVVSLAAPRDVWVAEAKITLAPKSQLRVAKPTAKNAKGAGTLVELISGTSTFDVAPRKAGTVFQVRANDVLVTVIGTLFTVSLEPSGGVNVSVEHGTVSVQRNNEAPNMLRSGDSLRKSPNLVSHKVNSDPQDSSVEAASESNPDIMPTAQVDAETKQLDSPSADSEMLSAKTESVAETVKNNISGRRVRAQRKQVRNLGTSKLKKSQPSKSSVERSNEERGTTVKVAVVPDVANPVESTPASAPSKTKPIDDSIRIEATSSSDPAKLALRKIVSAIGPGSFSNCINELQRWLKKNRSHRKWRDAYYALGYCEFKRGNKNRANQIFTSKALSNYRLLKKAGDYFNPRKPY